MTATTDPAWPQLEAELLANPEIKVVPIASAAGRDSLYRLKVTTRSRMGALALHTGGLLVDDGWLRVLGGGDDRGLPSLAGANGLPGDGQPPAALLVGYDVLGGRFEVNGPDPASVETRVLPLTHGITVYPFLWSQEAHHDLAATTRSPAPMTELFSLQNEFAVRFAAEPDTSTLHIRTV